MKRWMRHPLLSSTVLVVLLFMIMALFIGDPREAQADGALALAASILLMMLVIVMIAFTAWRFWSPFGSGLVWVFVSVLILMAWIAFGVFDNPDDRNPLWLTASRATLYIGIVYCFIGGFRKLRERYRS